MKTLWKYFLTPVLLVLPFLAFSQITEADLSIFQQRAASEIWMTSVEIQQANALDIRQNGNGNRVFLIQVASNSDVIVQKGFSNLIYSRQFVSGGQATLTQDGDGNQYRGTTIGEEIELSILQQGSYNSIDQNMAGSHFRLEIKQDGSYNQIQHEADGPGTPLKVYQRGNDMRIIIRSTN